MTPDIQDLLDRLASLVRCEHDDHTVAEEAADVICALEARLSLAHSFRVGNLDGVPVWMERCKSAGGAVLWAIRRYSGCLNRAGTWEYEPLSSSRDDDFLRRCRWDDFDEAFAAAEAAVAWEPK